MASSTSAKKVARVAARSGGGPSSKKQAAWLFPVAILAIVALGVGVVVFARNKNAGVGDNKEKPRARLSETSPYDHWHDAFAINVCGKELTAPNDATEDVLGIHSHGDGLIHVHPFTLSASGKRATLKKFFDQEGIKVTDDAFVGPDKKVYKAGETTCGGKATELVLAHWKDATTAIGKAPDKIFRKDFGKVQLTENYGAFTLALVAKGSTDIPAPSASAEIETLGAADGGTGASDAPTTGDVSGSGTPASSPESTPATSAGG